MRDLADIRDEIDQIDRQLVRLYEDRIKLTAQVAEYKRSTGKPVYDEAREMAKLDQVETLASSDATKQDVRELFEHIMAMSRKHQHEFLEKKA